MSEKIRTYKDMYEELPDDEQKKRKSPDELVKALTEPTGSLRDLLKQHEDDTRQFADLLLRQYKYAGIINRLANIILNGKDASDNDRYEAEQAIELVKPLL